MQPSKTLLRATHTLLAALSRERDAISSGLEHVSQLLVQITKNLEEMEEEQFYEPECAQCNEKEVPLRRHVDANCNEEMLCVPCWEDLRDLVQGSGA